MSFELGVREKEKKTGLAKNRQRKAKIFFACILVLTIVRKGCGFSLPCFIIPFKLGAQKRDRIIKWEVIVRESHQKAEILLLVFQLYLVCRHSLTEVMFLLTCAAEIKDLPTQRNYNQTDLDIKKKLYLFWTTF